MQNSSDALRGMLAMLGGDAPREGEYIGEDGLTHCERCHTATQLRVPEALCRAGLTGHVVRCVCRCKAEADEAEQARRASEAAMRKIDELRRMSMMSARLQAYTFERWVGAEPQRAVCEHYVANWPQMRTNNQGLLMLGAPSTGKTYAAACIANALLAQRVPTMMVSLVRLTSMGVTEATQKTIDQLDQAELLVLDDLGAERETTTARASLYSVIDARSRLGKPMIVTTNLSGDELTSTTDISAQRIYERVHEVCLPVIFSGPSRRMDEAKRRYRALRQVLRDPK